MFTIRVDRTTDGNRDGLQAMSYRVKPGETETWLMLRSSDGSEQTVTLRGADRAYVMNDSGRTIDTINALVRA